MNRIKCEVCGDNDILKQDNVFVCQACGCKYSLEEVKKLLVEITNPVNVVGIDDSDTLYCRALDWLNLQNEEKAIAVLKDMTEKYPGDKRSWQKLAFILPIPANEFYIETALKFDDTSFFEAVEKERAERSRKAEIACDNIRKGQGDEWIDKIFHFTNPIKVNPEYDFPCVNELLAEGEINAATFNECWLESTYKRNYLEQSRLQDSCRQLLKQMWEITDISSDGKRAVDFSIGGYYNNLSKLIIGRFIFYEYEYSSGDYYFSDLCLAKSETILSKAVIQQTFDEIERRRKGLCLMCGGKRAFWSGKCSVCE